MANIDEFIRQIRTATYGEEVRSSIINAIVKVNDDNEQYVEMKVQMVNAKDRIVEEVLKFDNLIDAGRVLYKNLQNVILTAGSTESDLNTAVTTAKTVLDNLTTTNETGDRLKTELTDLINSAELKEENLQRIANEASTSADRAETARNTAVNAVEGFDQKVTDSTEAIKTEGTTQVNNVKAEGTAQKTILDEEVAQFTADRQLIHENKENIQQKVASAFVEQMSGTVIAVDDVSPIQHVMDVSVESENLIDISDETEISTAQFDMKLEKGTYSISWESLSPIYDDMPVLRFMFDDGTSSKFYFSGSVGNTGTIELKKPTSKIWIYSYGFNAPGSVEHPVKIKKLKIQKGTVATPWTPYITDVSQTHITIKSTEADTGTTYSVNPDGTVDNVLSVSPNMTIMSDTEGILINTVYNQDGKIWMRKLLAEIVSGGVSNDLSILKNHKDIQKLKTIAETSGNPVYLEDSAEELLKSLEIVGSTTQGENPSPEKPEEIVNGVIDGISWGNGADFSNAESIEPITLSKWDTIKLVDGVWYKENDTANRLLDGSPDEEWIKQDYHQYSAYKLPLDDGEDDVSYKDDVLVYCNAFKGTSYNSSWKSGDITIVFSQGAKLLVLHDAPTLDEFRVFLKQNPVTITYKTATPTLEPLPAHTQDVLNRLQTFYPNSVIQTNEGITLNLQYVADNKLYNDRTNEILLDRIENLEQAILQI